MLQQQSSSSLLNNAHPAQLWIGAHDFLIQKTYEYLKSKFCVSNSCNTCVTCRHINEQQHHSTLWLMPEKQYTLEQLEPIFNTISFALAPHEHYFFIIQKADTLTPACANSLLKSIEEPPAGYHFILLAERADQILPTIRSRCVVQSYAHTLSANRSPLLNHFNNLNNRNPLTFAKDLDSSTINEHETIELLDILLKHWIAQYKQSVINNDDKKTSRVEQIITLLQHAFNTPPMPGSSKLFWKNLYLQFDQLIA